MIDLHSHILPGLDDGVATMDESLELARAFVADGVRVVAATPHVRNDFPTRPEVMEQKVAELRLAFAHERLALELLPGGEIDLGQLESLTDEDLRRFGLGGSCYLLLEFPYLGWPLQLGAAVSRLEELGMVAVLGHPERNDVVRRDPERLRTLVERGVLVQVTAASLDGRFGRRTRKVSLGLVERELAHLVASDAHAPLLRQGGMSAAARAVGDAELARWLTVEVPHAIVSSASPPPRPAGSRARNWLRRF